MAFENEKKQTAYLYDTPIENLFIAEYMPSMPGEYVKVFLYASMVADGPGRLGKGDLEEETKRIARELRMEPEEVAKAFVFFREMGLTEETPEGPRFLRMKEKLYGGRRKKQAEQNGGDASGRQDDSAKTETAGDADKAGTHRLLHNPPIAEMTAAIQNLTGRFLLPDEMEAIMSWIADLNVEPDLITRAYEYATSRGADNHRYVNKVLVGWLENGIRTRKDADEYLAERDERHFVYRRIMQALGFKRNVTEEEARLIDGWVDELGCSMEEIMKACAKTAGINNPNIKYVNAVLRNTDPKKAFGRDALPATKVMDYYRLLREQAEERAEKAREEVYAKVPRIRRLDQEMSRVSRDLATTLASGGVNKVEELEQLRESVSAMETEKDRLLTENSIPVDYMNIRYRCGKCRDTGIMESGERCTCYLEVAREAAEYWNKGSAASVDDSETSESVNR